MGANLQAGRPAWLRSAPDGLQGKDSWVLALNLLFIYSADGSEEDILNFIRDSVNLKSIQGLGWGLGKAGMGSEKGDKGDPPSTHFRGLSFVCLRF